MTFAVLVPRLDVHRPFSAIQEVKQTADAVQLLVRYIDTVDELGATLCTVDVVPFVIHGTLTDRVAGSRALQQKISAQGCHRPYKARVDL